MSATMADCKAAQTQQSNKGGGGLRTPSDAFRRGKRRWWGVCRVSVMAPSAGLWECSVVRAAAAVHLWGAGDRASSLEGRRRRLLTRRRPHWSRAFNTAGDGHSVERGGNGKDGSARDGSAGDGELLDLRGREAEASMQQTASEQEVNGRKASLTDFLLGLGNPDLGRHDDALAFGVVAPPLRRRGRHRRCMTSSLSSSSPGGLVATDNDDNDETTLKLLATPLTTTSSITSTRKRTRGEHGGADGDKYDKAIGGDNDVRHPKQRHAAVVASPHPAPPCASMLGMYPIRQEKEEERTMEQKEEAGKMLGVQK